MASDNEEAPLDLPAMLRECFRADEIAGDHTSVRCIWLRAQTQRLRAAIAECLRLEEMAAGVLLGSELLREEMKQLCDAIWLVPGESPESVGGDVDHELTCRQARDQSATFEQAERLAVENVGLRERVRVLELTTAELPQWPSWLLPPPSAAMVERVRAEVQAELEARKAADVACTPKPFDGSAAMVESVREQLERGRVVIPEPESEGGEANGT